MTNDAFEARLAAALRSDAERAITPVDAAAIAVRAMRQPAHRGRFPLLSPAVAAILVGTGLVAGSLLVAGTFRDQAPAPSGPVASATAAATVAATASPDGFPVVDADGRLLGATTWAVDVEPIPGLGFNGGRLHLVSGYGGATTSIRDVGGVIKLASDVVSVSPGGDLRLDLATDGWGCRAGDPAMYHATAAEGGLHVTLAVVYDGCPTRATALARTWVRTLMLRSDGGTGVVDAFAPDLLVTVPRGPLSTLQMVDEAQLGGNPESLAGYHIAVYRNPHGVASPCLPRGGAPVPLDPGGAAFETYLEGLPGINVTRSTSLAVDGYPARHVEFASAGPGGCDPDGDTFLWRVGTEPTDHVIPASRDGHNSLFLVDLPDATLLIVITPGDGPGQDEGSLLAGIRVLDGLPQPGAVP